MNQSLHMLLKLKDEYASDGDVVGDRIAAMVDKRIKNQDKIICPISLDVDFVHSVFFNHRNKAIINTGLCMKFALVTYLLWPGTQLWSTSDDTHAFVRAKIPEHTDTKLEYWVNTSERLWRFYDSESPRGHHNWLNLPCIRRILGAIKKHDYESDGRIIQHRSIESYLSQWDSDYLSPLELMEMVFEKIQFTTYKQQSRFNKLTKNYLKGCV